MSDAYKIQFTIEESDDADFSKVRNYLAWDPWLLTDGANFQSGRTVLDAAASITTVLPTTGASPKALALYVLTSAAMTLTATLNGSTETMRLVPKIPYLIPRDGSAGDSFQLSEAVTGYGVDNMANYWAISVP